MLLRNNNNNMAHLSFLNNLNLKISCNLAKTCFTFLNSITPIPLSFTGVIRFIKKSPEQRTLIYYIYIYIFPTSLYFFNSICN